MQIGKDTEYTHRRVAVLYIALGQELNVHISTWQKVTPESNTVHLGIKRDVSGKVNVKEKVTLGRRTAYSLMGAGFLSVNGLKTSQNSHINVKGRPLAQQLSCLTDSERPSVQVPIGPRFFPPL